MYFASIEGEEEREEKGGKRMEGKGVSKKPAAITQVRPPRPAWYVLKAGEEVEGMTLDKSTTNARRKKDER